MHPRSTQLVRESWQRVESLGPPAAALFYDNLFAADPQLRPLFKGDLSRQGERLLHMIGAAVGGLDDLPALQPVLVDLARRHAGYGVQEAHYATVGAALLKTLSDGLGEAFTPAVRDAWTQVYGVLSGVMIDAARGLPVGLPHDGAPRPSSNPPPALAPAAT